MTEKKWIQIAYAEADVISGELLEWSGLSDVWNKYELDNHHNFLSDIAETCCHIHIEREELDGGVPTHSWNMIKIETSNEELLRLEMKERVKELMVPLEFLLNKKN